MPSPKSKKRSSSTSVAQLSAGSGVRRGDIKISDPIPVDSGYDGHPPSTTADISAMSTIPWQQDATWPRKSTPPEMYHIRNASYGHERTQAGRASAGPSLIPSSISTAPSKNSLSRGKSSGGFRSVLKRMFGSKKGRLSENRKDYHRSDPGNLTSIIEKQTDPRVVPIPSRAVSHGIRGEALGSHCPTEAQNNLPRTSSDRKRLKSPRRRRRNTLPSLILTEQEAQILAGPKDDLAMQSWRQVEAVSNKFKRRSRSADALHDMAAGYNLKDIPPEDRTAQIAYWRTSVLDNPTPSYRWPVGNEDRPDSSRPPELAPIQTFDFGLEKADSEPATLEERVNTLEVKMFDFEYAIARLQGHDIPKPLLHPKAPPKRRSIHELFPSDSEKSTTLPPRSHEPTSFLASPEESPMPSGDSDERFRPDRSSKATTIRPLTARRLSPLHSSDRDGSRSSSSHLTTSQFDQLMDLLKQEQALRRKLEDQVAILQKEVELLRTPVYAEIRQAYPTPSPESVHETPVGPRHLHRSPRFYPLEKTSPVQKTPPPQQQPRLQMKEQSRFSMSDSIDTGMETETETDGEEGSFQDVYETPQGNGFVLENVRGSPLVEVS